MATFRCNVTQPPAWPVLHVPPERRRHSRPRRNARCASPSATAPSVSVTNAVPAPRGLQKTPDVTPPCATATGASTARQGHRHPATPREGAMRQQTTRIAVKAQEMKGAGARFSCGERKECGRGAPPGDVRPENDGSGEAARSVPFRSCVARVRRSGSSAVLAGRKRTNPAVPRNVRDASRKATMHILF